MTRRLSLLAAWFAVLGAVAAPASAQAPRIVNGRVTTQAAGPLPGTFRGLVTATGDVGWIGYAVPTVEGDRVMCCFDSGDGTSYVSGSMSSGRYCCGACRIEPSSGSATTTTRTETAPRTTGPIPLETGTRMIVLFRVAANRVEKIRVFSDECQLDAGGRPVTWLEGVRPADSVALLESFATLPAERGDSVMDGAVTAIALTGDSSADTALDRLIAVSQPEPLRRKVMFWLGNSRGAHGLATLQQALRNDPSAEVRKAAVFGVSQSRESNAITVLLGLARADADPKVRGEAIFWLGQKAGTIAAAAITDRIDNDPNTEVKKRAVFALSQMPPAEGVPLLINAARSNPNPEVRKQAMFWLGQSKDPKALAFFEEVLLKK